ncbi:MAG: DUF1592 domain-containing protein [Pirellulaceae bacterium]|nr:DUF1592 domain-containing protein [Pirellulaceae bacterium]
MKLEQKRYDRCLIRSVACSFLWLAILAIGSPAQAGAHLKTTPNWATQDSVANSSDDDPEPLAVKAATILARRCIECHDPISRAGELDLTKRDAAIRGGESGSAIDLEQWQAGQLWQQLESGNMPPVGYQRLEADELETIKQWLQQAASWPVPVIDPAEFGGDLEPAPSWLKRLTREQYIRTVLAITGIDIRPQAEQWLPADVRADGFTNTAYNLSIDLDHIHGYARLAREVAQRVDVPSLLEQFHSTTRDLDAPRTLLPRIGTVFFRGPLSSEELDSLLAVQEMARQEGGDAQAGLKLVLQVMLQSPRFLFLIETANESNRAQRVPDNELAVRLSYSLWGAPPDEELWRAVAANELSQEHRLRAQVQRMLRDPRARTYSRQFVGDWLDLERLSSLRPDREMFPSFAPELAEEMQRESLAFFDHVVWNQNRPLSDLFQAQVTFLTPKLAEHYGIPWDYQAHAKQTLRRRSETNQTAPWPVAMYVFDQRSELPIRNLGATGSQADLQTSSSNDLNWTERSLVFSGGALQTMAPPNQLIATLKRNAELTLEVVLRPDNLEQDGPARILTISSGTSQRNITLGQAKDAYHVRCRTRKTNDNGTPDLQAVAGSAQVAWTHLVYTFQPSGLATLYVNGQEQGTQQIGGDFSNWSEGFHLAIGNETSGDRPWHGHLRRVAIYDQALTPEQLEQANRELVRHDVSGRSERGGLLTQGSLLSVGGDQASMVARGLFIMEDLLFGKIGNPPPCVDSTPKPSQPGQTQRDLAMTRINNDACRSCHAKFEPFAFALEKFDGLGTYHELDRFGNQLRDDGEVQLPGSDEVISFTSTAQLLEFLSESERLKRGITRKLTQFAIGRPLVPADWQAVEEIHQQGWKNGGTYTSLMSEIMSSDLVTKKSAIRR